MPRDPVEPTPRRKLIASRRSRILDQHGGLCAWPDCDRADRLEIDHIVPLELGGSDEDENLQPLCWAHHRLKTADDARRIAKARRIRKRESGAFKNKRPILSKPFDKTRTRRLDGRTTFREPRKEP